jgi:hypothetical protein
MKEGEMNEWRQTTRTLVREVTIRIETRATYEGSIVNSFKKKKGRKQSHTPRNQSLKNQ